MSRTQGVGHTPTNSWLTDWARTQTLPATSWNCGSRGAYPAMRAGWRTTTRAERQPCEAETACVAVHRVPAERWALCEANALDAERQRSPAQIMRIVMNFRIQP